MDFEIGQELSWLHGDNIRIGAVIEVDRHSVKISGMDSEYWINKNTLIKKLSRRIDIPSIYDPSE